MRFMSTGAWHFGEERRAMQVAEGLVPTVNTRLTFDPTVFSSGIMLDRLTFNPTVFKSGTVPLFWPSFPEFLSHIGYSDTSYSDTVRSLLVTVTLPNS